MREETPSQVIEHQEKPVSMKKKGQISNVLLVVVFVIGLSLLLYPSISDYWNSFHQSRAIMDYAERVADLSNEEYAECLRQAREYNRTNS